MASAEPVPGSALDEPLAFSRIPIPKVWGGRALERAPGIELGAAGPIGETWELVDRDEHNSVVRDGAYAGRELRGMMLSSPASLLGHARPSARGAFPLLVKFLDARKPLSVQVHPDHRMAKRLGVEGGKDECWYVLSADPGASIYLGLKPGVDAVTFAEHAASPDVVDLLSSWPVAAGQFVHVPPGTVHAIGPGITLVEVQENCDVTFRLFDWGRTGLDGRPREAHVEQALLSIHYGERVDGPVQPALEPLDQVNRRARLLAGAAFTVELLELGRELAQDGAGLPDVYVVVAGRGHLGYGNGARKPLRTGDVVLAPASLGPHTLGPEPEMRVLKVRPGPGG